MVYDYVNENILGETIRMTQNHHLLNKTLSLKNYKDCIVVPNTGDIISSDCIKSSIFSELANEASVDTSTIGEICQKNCSAIYIGYFLDVWGHCLTDNLKKLWFFRTNIYDSLFKGNVTIVYTSKDGKPLKTYMIDLLHRLGLHPEKWLLITQMTRFSELFIPENSLIRTYAPTTGEWELFYTKEFSETIRFLKEGFSNDNDSKSVPLKVYFSRTKISKIVREIGEKSIECAFKKDGYQIIYPESLSVEDQYRILSNCSVFVATEGSISHNSIFCKPGTNVILLKKANYVNGYQIVINEICSLNVTYVDAHHTPNNTEWGSLMYGPFFLCITSELQKFLGHYIPHLPLSINPSWWWFCNRNRKCLRWLKNIVES